MRYLLPGCAIALALATAAHAGEAPIGASVDGLLAYARERNPDYAAMQFEAAAASERAAAAGALPDPRLRVELMDITMGGMQNPTLSPSRAGSTRYTLMQEVPWFGKRGLQREIAASEADAARARAVGSWAELAAGIKAAYAQFYYVRQSERLTREVLDLMTGLEALARSRYASGLAQQSDVIRAQVEQTGMRNELIMFESERRMAEARLNMLVARAPDAPLAAPGLPRALPAPARLGYAQLAGRLRERNPQLFADQARVKAAEKGRDLAYRNRYPDVAFGIAPVQVRNSVKEWELMVELNIPLQQASRRSQEREAEAMLAAARSRKDASANQALAELAENLSGLDAARRTEAAIAGAMLAQVELTYKSALASYENGKVDFATLLETQRQIRQTRQTLIKAQAEAQLRLAAIERLLGDEL